MAFSQDSLKQRDSFFKLAEQAVKPPVKYYGLIKLLLNVCQAYSFIGKSQIFFFFFWSIATLVVDMFTLATLICRVNGTSFIVANYHLSIDLVYCTYFLDFGCR